MSATALPNRERPNTETVLLNRAKLRKLSELPKLTTSSTESWKTLPKRAHPSTEQPLLIRANWRIANELPRCKKSSTASPLPNRAKDRTLSAEPI
jgi:hypothetical protein